MTEKEINDLLFEQAKALAEKKACQDKVYKDEPILFTAKRLLSEDDIPDDYAELVRLASDPAYSMNEAKRFYMQAKAMENFEEVETYVFRGVFRNPYPAFSRMNIPQLRGYFAWRTRVRHGRIEKTEYAFVVLYMSELINLIGVSSPDEGFDRLAAFFTEYCRLDTYLVFQSLHWVKNFAIYYGIDPAKYRAFAEAVSVSDREKYNDNISVLLEHRSHTKQEVVSAVCALSRYDISKSKWVKTCPGDAEEIIWRVYDSFFTDYESSSGGDLISILFPFMLKSRYALSFNALFYQQAPHPDCVYRFSPVEIYECRSGSWTCTGVEVISDNYKSQELGSLLKDIDYNARKQKAIAPSIQKPPVPERWNSRVEKIIILYYDELAKKEKERHIRNVKINTGLLDAIRADSDETRDRLLTEEELERDEAAVSDKAENTPEGAAAGAEQEVFSPLQRDFISLILEGGNLRTFAKEHGTFVTALADEINEITLDIIGDTAVECDGDTAEIIEDYIDEMRELAHL